jgi:hypothetical protein
LACCTSSAVDAWLNQRHETVLGVIGDDANRSSVAVWHNASLASTLPGLVQRQAPDDADEPEGRRLLVVVSPLGHNDVRLDRDRRRHDGAPARRSLPYACCFSLT